MPAKINANKLYKFGDESFKAPNLISYLIILIFNKETSNKNYMDIAKSISTGERYFEAVGKVCLLVVASFGVCLTSGLIAKLIESINQKKTGFDIALKLLQHYVDSVGPLLAFFSSVIFFISFTLVFEPSRFGQAIRRFFLAPSLDIAGHMFSLTTGVMIASVILEMSFDINKLFDIHLLKILISISALFAFAVLSSFASEFLTHDLEKLDELLGSWKYPTIICSGLILGCSTYSDLTGKIYLFKP